MGKVRLNENKDVVQVVREGLKRTGGYCPCRMERTEATNYEGYCHCFLYYTEK